MKKVILGCTLMLVGAICGTGLMIAHCCACVEPGAWSTVLNIFSGMDGFIAIVFYLIAVLGTAVAIKALKECK